MIADNFYPIFILMITVLACFIQKNLGGLRPTSVSPWTRWRVKGDQMPRPPLQSFLAWPKTNEPIFFLCNPLAGIYPSTFTNVCF